MELVHEQAPYARLRSVGLRKQRSLGIIYAARKDQRNVSGRVSSCVTLLISIHSTLASVGAAIILLSLPLDLFFQQIVSYPTVIVADTQANATISRTINYNPDEEVQWRGDDRNIHEDSQIMVFLYPFYQRTGSKCDRKSNTGCMC